MTTQPVTTKQKLEIEWTESSSFEVHCKQLPPQEPRALKNFTILITSITDNFPTSLAS